MTAQNSSSTLRRASSWSAIGLGRMLGDEGGVSDGWACTSLSSGRSKGESGGDPSLLGVLTPSGEAGLDAITER